MKIPSSFRWTSFLSALFFFHAASFSSGAETHELTDLKGRKIEAELQELTGEGVLKVRIKGRPFDIPLDQLVEEDRTKVKEWDEDKKAAAEGSEYGKVVFEDDFSKDGFVEAWGHYKSGSEVKDGVLQGFSPNPSDHAAVDNVKVEGLQDLEVSVKFRFVGPKGRQLDVWLDDWGYKGSHAGHICRVSVSRNGSVSMMDAKEGAFRKDIYEKKKGGGELDEEMTKALEGKSAKFDVKLKDDEWHTLVIRTKGDEVTALVNGKKAGSLQSPGIAHETKTLISLTTNEAEIHYDDFSIRTKRGSGKKR